MRHPFKYVYFGRLYCRTQKTLCTKNSKVDILCSQIDINCSCGAIQRGLINSLAARTHRYESKKITYGAGTVCTAEYFRKLSKHDLTQIQNPSNLFTVFVSCATILVLLLHCRKSMNGTNCEIKTLFVLKLLNSQQRNDSMRNKRALIKSVVVCFVLFQTLLLSWTTRPYTTFAANHSILRFVPRLAQVSFIVRQNLFCSQAQLLIHCIKRAHVKGRKAARRKRELRQIVGQVDLGDIVIEAIHKIARNRKNTIQQHTFEKAYRYVCFKVAWTLDIMCSPARSF